MLQLKNENEITKEQWSEFVLKSKYGNVFNSPEFVEVHKITGETEPQVIFSTNGSEINGVLVSYLHKERSLLLNKLTSRSIIWGGPIFNDDQDVLNELLNKYLNNKRDSIYTQIRNLYNTENHKNIFEKYGFNKIEHLNIEFDLKIGLDELWKKIHKYRRHNIKSCYKKGLFVRIIGVDEDKLLNESYNLVANVYKKVNLPLYSKNFFLIAVKKLVPINYLKIFGAFLNNKLIGVRYVLCYKNTIYDWYSGADGEYLTYRPNDILPWEVIKWGNENNYEKFDFGGAGKINVQYGVRDYKMKFGGTLVNYGRYELVHKKILMIIGKTGLFLKRKLKL